MYVYDVIIMYAVLSEKSHIVFERLAETQRRRGRGTGEGKRVGGSCYHQRPSDGTDHGEF